MVSWHIGHVRAVGICSVTAIRDWVRAGDFLGVARIVNPKTLAKASRSGKIIRCKRTLFSNSPQSIFNQHATSDNVRYVRLMAKTAGFYGAEFCPLSHALYNDLIIVAIDSAVV